MNYDRPYMSYRDQINHLKSNYGLVISNEDIAISLLSSLSYYDLINGYKQCFMDNEKYFPGTTIEDLYEFYSIDKTIQNLLFKYSIAVENRFKTILSNNISYNFGVDVLNYLDKKKL